MRISDWSSDVCSSDLLSAAGGYSLEMTGHGHADKHNHHAMKSPDAGHGAVSPNAEKAHQKQGENAGDTYYCPMHCEGDKTYDKPGNCPVCGMDLRSEERRVGKECVSTGRYRGD